MRKMVKQVAFVATIAALVWLGGLLADRQQLRDSIIRLHVVANSDSETDQAVKLQVRDAVMDSLRREMAGVTDVRAAESYLQENLPKLQAIANETLAKAGLDMDAVVTLCRESFDKRIYDTFTLPAGVYQALRITIGEGEGKNWWCVVYPSFCMSCVSESFADQAVGAGFQDSLVKSLEEGGEYEVRFFLLDKLGQLENIFFSK